MRLRFWVLVSLLCGCGRPGLTTGPPPTETPTSTPPPINDYAYRRPIDIQRDWVVSGVAEFPILIELDATFDYSAIRANGEDVRFTTSDGKPLAYELDEWNHGGDSLIWLTVDTIDPGASDLRVWMYYGNNTVADGQDAAGVWRAGYAGVWHLRGDGADSTSMKNDVTDDQTVALAGFLGDAREFDGGSDYILVADAPSLNPQAITVSAWFNADSWQNGNRRILQKGNDDTQYRLMDEDNVLRWDVAGVGQIETGLPQSDEWHHTTATYDGSDLSIYVDGLPATQQAAPGSLAITTDPLHIGTKTVAATAGDHFNGGIDEVRIASVARTPEWIAGQFRSMTRSLVTIGPEESL